MKPAITLHDIRNVIVFRLGMCFHERLVFLLLPFLFLLHEFFVLHLFHLRLLWVSAASAMVFIRLVYF